jgi:hypothetical protein
MAVISKTAGKNAARKCFANPKNSSWKKLTKDGHFGTGAAATLRPLLRTGVVGAGEGEAATTSSAGAGAAAAALRLTRLAAGRLLLLELVLLAILFLTDYWEIEALEDAANLK